MQNNLDLHTIPPSRFPTITVVTPTRALNTTFQPSATKPVNVIYTLELRADDAEDCTCELRSDAASPPTRVICSARNNFSVSALLGVTGFSIVRQVLSYIVPPGDNVRLVTSGTGTVTIAHQVEERF